TLPVPADPPLKPPSEFRILGHRMPRVDTPDKVSGAAVFGLDVRVPGMVYAAVARCPVFGGRVKTFDPAPALAVPGVQRVVQISSGVAVVAERTWAAFQGKRALKTEWEEGPTARWSSDGIWSAFAAAPVTRLPVEAVTVHVTYLGGGFGRRGGPTDYATEAVELAQKIAAPVQVVWTREDDIQNAVYRPATYNVLRAGLDARGAPLT